MIYKINDIVIVKFPLSKELLKGRLLSVKTTYIGTDLIVTEYEVFLISKNVIWYFSASELVIYKTLYKLKKLMERIK